MKTNTQSVSFAPARRLRLACGIGISAIALTVALLPQSVGAQTADSDRPLEDFSAGQNERDPFTGNAGGGGLSVFDMIHRSRLGSSQSLSDFNSEKQRELDNAADEFRRQQLEQLRNSEPVSPVPAPEN